MNKFRPGSIRDRLLLAFLLMVLIPAVAFGAASGIVGLERGREQVIDKLTSVAVLKEDELNTWAENAKTDLASVMIGEEVQQWIQTLFSNLSDSFENEIAYQKLHTRFDALLEQTQRFEELNILDPRGIILLSTERQREGGIGSRAIQSFLRNGEGNEYLYPPSYSLASLTAERVGIVVVRPIYDENEQLLGILAGRTSSLRLNEIMLERTGLGETGETFLVATNHVMITEPRIPEKIFLDSYYIFSEGAEKAIKSQTNGSGVYTNHRGVKVVGVYRWLPDLQVALLAEQAEHEAMAVVRQTFAINIGVAITALLFAVGVSVLLARSIVTPLSDLAKTAVRVSEGDLDLLVPDGGKDEIGALAKAFNQMTWRLREMIHNLDQQVRERTEMLRRRALQQETSAQVGREITSILDMEKLSSRIVNLIAEAFGYYNVGIYLVDTDSGRLVFRAGAGEIKDLGEGRPIEIGSGSLNGEAAGKNEIMIVNDVVRDARYFADDRFPDTRSELVVPLRIGERVIGTLDVLSNEVGAFSEEDARIIQGLGDQVAVAIENARLYERNRLLAVVEERNRLARELHDSVTQSLYAVTLYGDATSRLLESGDVLSAAENLDKVITTTREALGEMRLLVFELRPPVLQEEGLVGALETRLEAVERRVGLQTAIHVEGNVRLDLELEEGLYRIAVEALNNIIKHARASKVTVLLRLEPDRVIMEVGDNGVGFDLKVSLKTAGMGLRGMADRVEKLGGRFVLMSEHGAGTKIRVEVDL
ncbi:MAG: GAF domain-containing protein [Anaerolineales bacterium]|nr:GAF domain-containing protein [Anaerolineales bacterium]